MTRTGSPEVATDVMGVELSDVFVTLKPQQEWTTAGTREDLIAKMKPAILDAVPGVGLGFTQPIEMRFNELIAELVPILRSRSSGRTWRCSNSRRKQWPAC